MIAFFLSFFSSPFFPRKKKKKVFKKASTRFLRASDISPLGLPKATSVWRGHFGGPFFQVCAADAVDARCGLRSSVLTTSQHARGFSVFTESG